MHPGNKCTDMQKCISQISGCKCRTLRDDAQLLKSENSLSSFVWMPSVHVMLMSMLPHWNLQGQDFFFLLFNEMLNDLFLKSASSTAPRWLLFQSSSVPHATLCETVAVAQWDARLCKVANMGFISGVIKGRSSTFNCGVLFCERLML